MFYQLPRKKGLIERIDLIRYWPPSIVDEDSTALFIETIISRDS